VDETGFGIRLDTYGHAAEELTGAIERLLEDEALATHLGGAAARLQAKPGTASAADRIEEVAKGGRS